MEYKYGFPSHIVAEGDNSISVLTNATTAATNVTTTATPADLTDEQVLLYWSITVSIYAAGGMLAGFTGSYFAKKLGRLVDKLACVILIISVSVHVACRIHSARNRI